MTDTNHVDKIKQTDVPIFDQPVEEKIDMDLVLIIMIKKIIKRFRDFDLSCFRIDK